MKKTLLIVSCVLLSSITTMWADEVTYSPQQDVCFRTAAGNASWQYANDAAAEGNTNFEGNYNAGIFVLQKYTVADLANATTLTLTLTDTGTTGVDGTMVWIYPNNDWSAETSAEDMLPVLTQVVGVAPRSSEGTVNSPLATGKKVPDSSPAQGYFDITGDALAKVKAAAQNGTFTLMITDKNLISNSSRKFYSSNSANDAAKRPTLVAKVEIPAVMNETTGVGYSSLNDAVSAVTGEATLVINEDIELTARVNVPADVTLNIIPANDGITIKRANSNTGNILILPGSGCTLNLGTAGKQLVIDGQNVEATSVAIEASNGTVTITNVIFKNCISTNSQGVLCRKSNSEALIVEDCAFENCTVPSGRGVIFCGKNVTELKGNNTFTGCTGGIYLEKQINLNGAGATHTTPIELIIESSREVGTIVEGGKADQYTLTGGNADWKLAQDGDNVVIEDSATGIQTVDKDMQNGEATIYNLSGQYVSQPQKGLYIINGKKMIVK